MTPPSVRVPETESNRRAALSTIGRFTAGTGSASTLGAPSVASRASQKLIVIRVIVSLPYGVVRMQRLEEVRGPGRIPADIKRYSGVDRYGQARRVIAADSGRDSITGSSGLRAASTPGGERLRL